jgi:hypothetical protein
MKIVSNWNPHTKVWGIYSGNIPQTEVWGACLKVISLLLFITFIFFLSGPSFSTVKKAPVKKTKVKVKVTKKKVKVKVKTTGARPVFPVEKGPEKVTVTKEIKIIVAPRPEPKPEPKPRARIFAEGGYGAGGLVIEGGYGGLELMKKVNFSAAAGIGIGSGFSVIILDLARVTYDVEKFFVGGGINYAMYSSPNVRDIPGLSGRIPSQNMLGVELLGGMHIADKISARLGFSTAMGLRAAVGYEF